VWHCLFTLTRVPWLIHVTWLIHECNLTQQYIYTYCAWEQGLDIFQLFWQKDQLSSATLSKGCQFRSISEKGSRQRLVQFGLFALTQSRLSMLQCYQQMPPLAKPCARDMCVCAFAEYIWLFCGLRITYGVYAESSFALGHNLGHMKFFFWIQW